jgi:hypothetical protein
MMTALNSSTNASPRYLPSFVAAAAVGAIFVGAATCGPANLNLSLSLHSGHSFLHLELGCGSTPLRPTAAEERPARAH